MYVDEQPIDLVSATCDGSAPAACTSPLPPLTDGVHTLVLVNVDTSGIESVRSEALVVQKLSSRATTPATSLWDAPPASSPFRVEAEVGASNGLAFAADVVARAIRAPAQLAALPDGRVLVAEADGMVRVVRPGHPRGREAALDARALLQPPPIGPLGIARHRDFLRNRFVYVAFLAGQPPERARLRVVRLREVGDALGEPASLFEAPVAAVATALSEPPESQWTAEGPRMAFGPDGLLYLALPLGLEFRGEPAASTPRAAMLRLSDAGNPAPGVLSGVDAHPLGFTWHPSTNELWAMFPGRGGETMLRTLGTGITAEVVPWTRSGLRTTESPDQRPASLVAQGSGVNALALARALVTSPGANAERPIRLALPLLAGRPGDTAPDLVGDAVVDSGGTLFLVTRNARLIGGPDDGDVVVRLTPHAR